MAIGLVRPSDDEVLHFSDDPSITLFMPHVAATAQEVSRHLRESQAVSASAPATTSRNS